MCGTTWHNAKTLVCFKLYHGPPTLLLLYSYEERKLIRYTGEEWSGEGYSLEFFFGGGGAAQFFFRPR